jgi:hypothetical protein
MAAVDEASAHSIHGSAQPTEACKGRKQGIYRNLGGRVRDDDD